MSRLLWHYTTGQYFYEIVTDGFIRPSTALLDPGERPITWFSANQDWERTASKGLLKPDGTVAWLSMEQTGAYGGGLVRFGVSLGTAPYNWRALKELSGMSSATARHLYQVAIDKGARPGEWYGTFDPVPREKWRAVHVYHKGEWVPVAMEQERAA